MMDSAQGVPSLAVSLDDVRAKSAADYAAASVYTVALIKVEMLPLGLTACCLNH